MRFAPYNGAYPKQDKHFKKARLKPLNNHWRELFDFNEDGYISLSEMSIYLVSVFKVLFEAQPGMEEQMGVSAEELGLVTADQCFKEADLNSDGRLSFEEFRKWYSKPGSFL